MRDVKDNAVGTLSTNITAQLGSLKSLQARLEDIHGYLAKVVAGTLPINHQIIYNLQDMFNLLPNIQVPELSKAFSVKTNDEMLVLYLSNLVRSVLALHNLIDNKIKNQDDEKPKETKTEKKEEDKDTKMEVVEGASK